MVIRRLTSFLILLLLACFAGAQTLPTTPRQKIIIDTDIGDDIDDAFALALALSSPEFEILGVTAAWGDTQMRARVVDRMLCETGMDNIPIAAGASTESKLVLDHAPFARSFWKPVRHYGPAVDFILDQIRKYPHQITLIAIAPLKNIGDVIERDPQTFNKLKRVVIMGGSVYRGYNDLGYLPSHGPDPEYNIVSDIGAARRLFASGVPLYVMPLDSTQLKLDEIKREIIFRQSTSLTDDLTLLYHLWGGQTPTLYDPVAVAYALQPNLCPTQPMRLEIDDKGYTRPSAGAPNAEVCLDSREEDFFRLYMSRILSQKLRGQCGR
ncbi:MAG TPA: nucleoside hydrolase [Terriglobales bacterium]